MLLGKESGCIPSPGGSGPGSYGVPGPRPLFDNGCEGLNVGIPVQALGPLALEKGGILDSLDSNPNQHTGPLGRESLDLPPK